MGLFTEQFLQKLGLYKRAVRPDEKANLLEDGIFLVHNRPL